MPYLGGQDISLNGLSVRLLVDFTKTYVGSFFSFFVFVFILAREIECMCEVDVRRDRREMVRVSQQVGKKTVER